MDTVYSKNFFKIYLWQGLSFILTFLSLFIVVPIISTDKPIYGIYTVCMSLSIFLSYADLGFLGAGQKFAAEYFAKKDIQNEIRVTGFTAFILLICLLLFSGVFLVLSYHPQWIIKNLTDFSEFEIAKYLLLILALSTPITLLQRVVQTIYIVRLEDYVYQRINIIGNLLKISAVFYFFRDTSYDIVGYFLFIQLINLCATVINIGLARRRYGYNIYALFRAIRFDREVFDYTKSLAYSLFFSMFSWVLYYELDTIAIGSFWGAEKVAIYSIGLTLLTFIRNIFGILFSPFSARFNHLEGLRDETNLRTLLDKILILYAPITMFSLLSVALLAKPLVFSWVDVSYRSSVPIVHFLVLCNFFAFISYPLGMLLVAKQRVKEMFFINWLIPLIFWIGILVSKNYFEERSFAIFKLISFFIMAVVYYRFLLRFLNISLVNSLKRYIFATFPSVLFLISFYFISKDWFVFEKSIKNLIIVTFIMGGVFSFSLLIHYFTSSNFRVVVKSIIAILFKKNKF